MSFIPVARDGTHFGDHLLRSGHYQIGDKGAERKFTDFRAALDYLKSIPTARWRRPNAKGNWGIVAAVEWAER